MNDINIKADLAPMQSELAEALHQLEAQYQDTPILDQLPTALAAATITPMPEVFYTRGNQRSEHHIGILCKTLQAGFALEPLLVIRVAEKVIVVDGHHRLEAYGRVQNAPPVPIRCFLGTPSEALLEAVRRNSQPSIQMDGRQRQDCAWRLVLTRLYSKREIAMSSGVSQGQIGNMRVAARELGEDALDMATWSQAQRAWKGKSQLELSDDEMSLWVQQQAERGAEGMRKLFGMWLANKPEIAAHALALYFGRRLPEVHREMRDHLAEYDAHFGSPDYGDVGNFGSGDF